MDGERVTEILEAIGAENVVDYGKNIQCSCFLAQWRQGHSTYGDHSGSMGISVSRDNTSLVNCFSGDTGVLVRDQGVVPIQDLAGGSAVILTLNEFGQAKWQVAPFKNYGRQDLCEIRLSRNGVKRIVRATSGHRWFVRSSTGKGVRWIERTTEYLIKGHRLRSAKFPTNNGLKVSGYGIGHGIVFGDGNLSSEGDGSLVHLWGEKDKSLLRFFPWGTPLKVKTPRGTQGLRVRGLPRYFKSLPKLDESRSYLYGWLAGYFAADGCVDKHGMPTLASSRYANLEHVQNICIGLGIFTYGIRSQDRLGFGKEKSKLYVIGFSRRSLSEDFFLLSGHRDRWRSNRDVVERHGWVVESVVPGVGTEEVYCAEVEGGHCFTLDGHILTGNCFSCGYRGTLLRAVAELGRLSRVDYSELVSRIKKIEEKSPTEVAAGIQPYEYSSTSEVVSVVGECTPRMLFSPGGEDYLMSRGFDRETIREWGCWYDSEFSRAVIPIRRSKALPLGCGSSDLVGAVGRTTVGYEVKYFNYFKFRRGDVLFGEDHISPGSRGVVVEGLLDTMAVWQGLRNAGLLSEYSVVGILGSHATREQVSRLVRFFNEVILFLDNDQAGWTGQVQLSLELGKRVFLRAVNYPGLQGEDPMVLIERKIDIVSLIQKAHLVVA